MSRTFRREGVAILCLLAISRIGFACLWDYDTVKQERARFPGTLEIITGKFLRHSNEFYEWRIKDRIKKISAEPTNASLYDDLAVAYAKIGNLPLAIETMQTADAFAPNRYETLSNLATFYFLVGDFERALRSVDQALAINPDAHFGRERYQKWLTEYVSERVAIGKQLALPLRMTKAGRTREQTFATFLFEKLHPVEKNAVRLSQAESQAAVNGVLGMMRFANYNSPVLLEVLADLLMLCGPEYQMGGPTEIDAKQLAARAYLQASYHAKQEIASESYRQFASRVIQMQLRNPKSHDQLPLEELEDSFQLELADANRWYSDLRANELNWIKRGENPEWEFDQLYLEEPTITDRSAEHKAKPTFWRKLIPWSPDWLITATQLALVIGSISLCAIYVKRKRCRSRSCPAQ